VFPEQKIYSRPHIFTKQGLIVFKSGFAYANQAGFLKNLIFLFGSFEPATVESIIKCRSYFFW